MSMTNQQWAPEALRLPVQTLIELHQGLANNLHDGPARNLHLATVAALVEAQQPATHVQNPAEIAHVTGDVSKNGPESNMAQQPAPSAAVVVNPDPHAELRKTWQPGQRWQARSFRNGQWGPWTDAVASEPFWFPHQDYRRHPDDLAPQPSPTPQADSQPAPIDMVLHCPACGLQHIDAPEQIDRRLATIDPPAAWAMDPWKNEPHRSHLCHGCGHIWRPADVPTNGVMAVKTTGKADSPIAARAPADSVLEDAALLQEARTALWQPANVDLCERIDAYLDAARKQGANHD